MKLKLFMAVILLMSTYCFSQVGINTNNPNSTLEVNGSFSLKTHYVESSNEGILLEEGYLYIINSPSSSEDKVIIPESFNVEGRIILIRNNNPTIDIKISSENDKIPFVRFSSIEQDTSFYMNHLGDSKTHKFYFVNSVWLVE